MPPESKTRKWITKGHIAWCVSTFALWLLSILFPIEWVHTSGNQIELSHGQVCVTHWIVKDYAPNPGLRRADRPVRTIHLAYDYAKTRYLRLFALPLWPLILVPAFPIALHRYRLYLTKTRIKSGSCPNCGYDRSGLSTTAPCPECNAQP